MTQTKKIRVAVLSGGRSGEHEVSIRSAANVMQHLDRSLFDVIPLSIDKKGSPTQLLSQLKNPEQFFDVVFPAIHGTFCEDGTIQGLLELANIPYVGCGVLASAIGMDKDMAKRLVKNAGVAVAPYLIIKHDQWKKSASAFCQTVTQTLQFPVFVKPANAGSSVGIEKVKHPDHLIAAINQAFQYDTKILVEQGINGIELEVAVLETQHDSANPLVSIVGEIRPRHEFYSYAAKYLDENGAELLIPAEISPEISQQVREAAKAIFIALECEGMARVDLFLDRTTHQIYFNEINTLPGFTEISMYPKMIAASGVKYSDLLTQLIHLAITRHGTKNKISHEYISNTQQTTLVE